MRYEFVLFSFKTGIKYLCSCGGRYAEDPATGIAAAALTASLCLRGILPAQPNLPPDTTFCAADGANETTIFQGRAMGRCSAIRVSVAMTDSNYLVQISGNVSDRHAVE